MSKMQKMVGVWAVAAIAAVLLVSPAWSVNDELKAEINAIYERNAKALEAKDLDALMADFSEDYLSIYTGIPKEGLKGVSQQLFSYEELRVQSDVEKIEAIGDYWKTIVKCKVTAKKDANSEWREIFDEYLVEYLRREDGELKFYANCRINTERNKWIKGQTYNNTELGYKFSAPKDWQILPAIVPNMMEGVVVLAPDLKSFMGIALLELPESLTAKATLEGDDAACKNIAGDGYKLIKAGETQVGGADAYESITEFKFSLGGYSTERKRWRVYFRTGGLLYVVFCDAMPPSQWEKVKPGFDAVMNSFSFDQSAENSAQTMRSQEGEGEIAGRIYTNSEYGCQIAAPEGWKTASVPMGEAYLFSILMTPEEGDGRVRFLAADTKGAASLEKMIKSERDAIKALTNDAQFEDVEDVDINGYKGKSYISQFSLENIGNIKRKSVMILHNDIVYVILCETDPPSSFESASPEFEEVIQSFTLN